MSKGYQKHKERLEALTLFGRDLARRSKSHCELCDTSGVKLVIYEVAPIPDDPDYDHCIFVCETCQAQLDNPKRLNADHWRCLYESIWSEVPAVQVTAVRVARQLNTDWANDLLDQLYLPPEVSEWLDQAVK